jgi:hypothetical protein
MELLVDEAQVDAHFIPFGDNPDHNAGLVCGLRQTYQGIRNCFGHTC